KERAPLDDHVESCSKCAAEASEWLGLLGLMKATPLESAPDNAVRNCMEVYTLAGLALKVEDVCAQVVFDSQIEKATVGVRGFTDSQQIHLQTTHADIHLCAVGVPRVIVGQLLARPDGGFVTGAQVELLHQNKSIEMTVTDALGEFRLGNVPAGSSRIQAYLPSGVRLIGSFTINAEDNEE